MKQIENKKLLLIAPLFFDYYQEIMKELEKIGYVVDYVCDAPSNSNMSKALGRINKKLIINSTVKYFNNTVVPMIKGKKYNKVFVVAGMTFALTLDMMNIIREMNPEAEFIMYQWDSEKNLPYCVDLHGCFDKVYSFDRIDCDKKSIYQFLPLFYTGIYKEIGEQERKQFEYDCSYVGTAHPQKFKNINEMSERLFKLMPRQYIYHYMPSILKYIYHKITSKEYQYAKLSDFKRQRLSPNELMRVFRQSRCVLDAPQAGQIGLTIRTIECIGAKRKLITTNTDIKNYDLYCETNVLVYDGDFDVESPFFTEPYQELPADVYKKYSLHSWLETILS